MEHLILFTILLLVVLAVFTVVVAAKAMADDSYEQKQRAMDDLKKAVRELHASVRGR